MEKLADISIFDSLDKNVSCVFNAPLNEDDAERNSRKARLLRELVLGPMKDAGKAAAIAGGTSFVKAALPYAADYARKKAPIVKQYAADKINRLHSGAMNKINAVTERFNGAKKWARENPNPMVRMLYQFGKRGLGNIREDVLNSLRNTEMGGSELQELIADLISRRSARQNQQRQQNTGPYTPDASYNPNDIGNPANNNNPGNQFNNTGVNGPRPRYRRRRKPNGPQNPMI